MNANERAQIVNQKLKELYPQKSEFPLKYRTPWELLVAVVLSARTTDIQVNKATQALFKKYKTLEDYANADLEEFERDISSIGLYKSKAKNIIGAAKMVKDVYKSKLPKTVEEMTKLSGVGQKSANVILGQAFGVVEGIVVDTHVVRLAKKFGLTRQTDPKKIEEDLIRVIPRGDWWEFANRIKLYGQEVSPARKVGDDTDPISRLLK